MRGLIYEWMTNLWMNDGSMNEWLFYEWMTHLWMNGVIYEWMTYLWMNGVSMSEWRIYEWVTYLCLSTLNSGILMPASLPSPFPHDWNKPPTREINVVSKARLRRTTCSANWAMFPYTYGKAQRWSWPTPLSVNSIWGGYTLEVRPEGAQPVCKWGTHLKTKWVSLP